MCACHMIPFDMNISPAGLQVATTKLLCRDREDDDDGDHDSTKERKSVHCV